MNEQQIREIAENAFSAHFGEIEIVRVDVNPRLDHDGDPVVDVDIVYNGKFEQVADERLMRVQSEIVSKSWREVEEDLGYPLVHFIAKPSIMRRGQAAE